MNNYKKFLEIYFSLFDAHIIEYRENDNNITGVVGWVGEIDKQAFKWYKNIPVNKLNVLIKLCSFIKENKLNVNDRLLISETQLITMLVSSLKNWDKKTAQEIINLMFNVEIKMLDNGEETDSFFIHR